jgi:uncharacterized membrane protein YqjE
MDSAPRASATDSARSTATNGNGRRGLVELARMAVEDTVRLVQQEIQLAKIEIQEMLRSNIQAAIFLGAAGLCAMLGLVMLLVFIPLMFLTGDHVWIFPVAAFVALVEVIVFLVGAAILGLIGKNKLKIGAPPKTMTTLKEDAEWARQVLKRNGK